MKKTALIISLIYFCMCNLCFASAEIIDWSCLDQLPPVGAEQEALGVAAPFAGVSNGAIIIAGGAYFPKPFWESEKTWVDDVWVLDNYDNEQREWIQCKPLVRPAAYGVSVTTPFGLVCVGGKDAENVFPDSFLLKWDSALKIVVRKELPVYPSGCADSAGVYFDGKLYIAGGITSLKTGKGTNSLFMLDLSTDMAEWKELANIPGEAVSGHMLTVQHNGTEECIYLMGGTKWDSGVEKKHASKEVYSYLISSNKWSRNSDMPVTLSASTSCEIGQSGIFVFGGADGSLSGQADILKDAHPGFLKTVYYYNTITDKWTSFGDMPKCHVTSTAINANDSLIIFPGELRPRVRSCDIMIGRLKSNIMPFGWINFAALIIYLLAMVAVGLYFAAKNKNTNDYFRGGQKIPSVVAGLSIFATCLSSITFVAMPAKVYMTDWTFLPINLAIVAVTPLVIFYIMPKFKNIDITSAYEYLEIRFNLFIRLFAAFSFVIFQIGRMAIVMFLPALALSVITSLSVVECILIMGILSVVYCTAGGLEAVVWTDALQSIVLLGGAGLSLALIITNVDHSFSEIWSGVQADGKLHVVNWDFSKTSIYTSSFWVMVVGGLGQAIIPLASDQAVVQRYLSVSDVRQARKSLMTSLYVCVLATFIFFCIGTALYVFYQSKPDQMIPGYQNDTIFPLFIATQLPAGIAGIVVAGVFAAAQSTISTSMNSISTVIVTDFMRRFSLLKSERAYFNAARICTFVFGVIGTLMAVLIASADVKSLWESFMSVLGLFGGTMCGLFMLGMFARRVGGVASIIGAIVSVAVVFYVKSYTKVSFLLYATISILVCYVVGYISSFLVPEKVNIIENEVAE